MATISHDLVQVNLCKSASPLDRDEAKMDLMLVNLFRPKVLTLCYPVHIETLAVIYWNSRVALMFQREKVIGVSRLHKVMIVMLVNNPVKL